MGIAKRVRYNSRMQNEEPSSESPVDVTIPLEDNFQEGDVPAETVFEDGSVEWTASEFIAHTKSIIWYLALAGITLVLAALIFLITKDKISTAVVVVAGVLLGVYGARKPKEVNYKLSGDGLVMADKNYPLSNYRSFSVIEEGAFRTLVFLPVKRFGLLLSIHYDPVDEDKIMNILGQYLPMEERKKDLLDDLLWKIRF